ncbi:MAG TPA: ATP-binding protein [Polyangiaceae bacterium]|nr:ATP-binding protein [Polyangiaceae bacterium]
MDLRTRTSLLCGAIAIIIAISILLRGRMRPAQIFFALFSADVGLWYLAQWLYHFVHQAVWWRFTAILAVLLPQFALHLFEAIFPRTEGRSLLLRVAGVLAIPQFILVLSPVHGTGFARGVVFFYVFGLFAAGLWSLWLRGSRSRSRATQRRVRFIVLIGAAAALFSLADFLWFIGAPLPPVGAVLSIVFLYVLAESLIRERLVDLYEMAGRALVSTAVAFALAGIFYVFAELVGGFQTMYLNAILAAIGMLTLFEPLRAVSAAYVHRAFRERIDLERAVTSARRALTHVLEVDEMVDVVTSALEDSQRATGAAIYLRDPIGMDYERAASFGPRPPERIEWAAVRPLLERVATAPVVLETIAEKVSEARASGEPRAADPDLAVLGASEVLGPFRQGVCLAIRAESGENLGLLLVTDERVTDAWTGEDVLLLESLALQIGVVVENSREYRRLRERDRLAALGQMAAGLAHEIKNPLGAIKGAAQLLADPGDGRENDPTTREFVGIILEEVDRLDRVVRSVLDYGRPSTGNPASVDVNAAVRRTLQVLGSSRDQSTRFVLETDDSIPAVRVDEEQLRQVLINLVRNAEEAMGGAGVVTVTTRRRPAPNGGSLVAILVQDRGPGIPEDQIPHLFVPFFTTKPRGTGLGLAISQRMVQSMGGRIEVASVVGVGSVFTVLLPAPGAAVPAGPAKPSPASPERVSLEKPEELAGARSAR